MITDPPLRSADVAHDRQAEPRARQRPGILGPVEAVEHPEVLLRRDPGPAVVDDDGAVGTSISIGPPERSNLAALSTRLETARSTFENGASTTESSASTTTVRP